MRNDSRVHFETFDSSSREDRRDEKIVFKLISKLRAQDLHSHIVDTQGLYDIVKIFDRSGYSPLHFAAYKNSAKISKILCEFVLIRGVNESNKEN